MEFLDKCRVINKAFSGFPGQLVIANPADKVMQGLVSAAAHELGIHDLIDFEMSSSSMITGGGGGDTWPGSGSKAAGSRRDTWKTG